MNTLILLVCVAALITIFILWAQKLPEDDRPEWTAEDILKREG